MIKPGDVIAYIPNHVLDLAQSVCRFDDGSIAVIVPPDKIFTIVHHPDCEIGFVTSIRDGNAWCRFWRRDDLNDEPELRTTTCSERVSMRNLQRSSWVLQKTQAAIDAVCEKYGIEIRRDNDGN